MKIQNVGRKNPDEPSLKVSGAYSTKKNSSEKNFNIAFKHTIINPSHKLISNKTIDFSSQNTERKKKKRTAAQPQYIVYLN